MIREGERRLRALGVGADEPVLLPADGHRHPTEGQVDVGHHRAVLHPHPAPALGAEGITDLLFDRDLTGRTPPGIRQDANVLESNEVGNDLVRIDVHRGVEDLLFHTLRLKRLCAYAVDTR
jgi:hypothetical protein